MDDFFYLDAFSRNLGWLSEYEQIRLKNARVAIAGMGGVGGIYLLTCVRLGIEKFNISDFDLFELGNFNRQVGSATSTIGQSKTQTMIKQALDINPNLSIQTFDEGVNASNVESFLDGVDVYLDGLDLFAMDARRLVFKKCQERKIPAITHAPIAMGFSQMTFTEKSPDFDTFFDFKSYDKEYHPLAFVLGLAPKMLQKSSLHDPSRIHFKAKKVSSTMMGCNFCAGSAVTEGLKHILKRGNRLIAPYGLQYDGHSNIMKKTKLRWGNRGWLQRLKLSMAIKQIEALYPYPYEDIADKDDLDKILHFASWAPSGHNLQSSKAKRVSDDEVDVHVEHLTMHLSEEELNRSAYVHFGIYLESFCQAASLFQYRVVCQTTEDPRKFRIKITHDAKIESMDTAWYLRARWTDRRSYSVKRLCEDDLAILKHVLGDDYALVFTSTWKEKLRHAMQECRSFSVMMHQEGAFEDNVGGIAPCHPYSQNQIPLKSLRFTAVTSQLFRLLIKTPHIMKKLNNWGGYLFSMCEYVFPRQFLCAGHFKIVRKNDHHARENIWIEDGRAIQRFWLKATSLGVFIHPGYYQLVISRDPVFSDDKSSFVRNKTKKIQKVIAKEVSDVNKVVFSGRLGFPKNYCVDSRSTRLWEDKNDR